MTLLKMIFQSEKLAHGFGFEVMFKCMSGSTTKNGKFIMPLGEKLTYTDSVSRCDSWGFIDLSLQNFTMKKGMKYLIVVLK